MPEGRLVAAVPPGLELEIVVEAEGRDEEVEGVLGPSRPGERVDVEIVLDRPLPVIVGRLLDPEGAPLAEETVHPLRLAPDQPVGLASGQTRTDGGGRFRHTIEHEVAHGLELLVGRPATLGATFPGLRLHPGVNDLGDVRLHVLVPFLNGTVRDETGVPVPAADVQFYADAQEDTWSSGTWLPLPRTTDAAGRFELRESVDLDAIGLQVQAPGFLPLGPRIFPRGAADIEITLRRGGTIEYELRYDGDRVPVVQVVPRPGIVFSTGTSLGPLPAGRHTVQWSMPWADVEGQVPDVFVTAGEATVDPRLNPLDLRGVVTLVQLTVVDEDGTPVPGVAFGTEGHGPLGIDYYPARRSGDAWTVTVGSAPLHLWVSAPGFRAQELVDVDADRRIVLERGPRVRWGLAGVLPRLPDGWTIEGELVRRGPLALTSPAPPVPLDDGGGELTVSAPGTYTLRYALVQRAADRELDRVRFTPDPPFAFEVPDGAAAITVRLPAPPPATAREMRARIDEAQ